MRQVRLKDVVRINARTLPESTDPNYSFRYIDIGSVDSFGNINIPEEPITFGAAPSRARRLAPAGSTIVSTVRTYLRAIARVPDSSDPLVFSTGFAVLEGTDEIDPRFLFYYCCSEPFIQEIISRSVGVSYPAINAYEIGEFIVRLPPLQEQRRIADFLDQEIARLREIENIRQRARGLIIERAAVSVDRIVRGADRNPLVRAEFSPLGMVPASWRQGRLRSIPCHVQTGPFGSQLHADDYVDEGWPVINPSNITPQGLIADRRATVNEATRSRLSRHILRTGDVVFARRGELGRAAIVTSEQDGWLCGTGCLRIRFLSDIFESEYLRRYLGIPAIRHYFQLSSVGSTMDNLNTSVLLAMPLLIPPINEQREIARRCDAVEEAARRLVSAFDRQLSLLTERRQALITAAVTGQIDVTTARGVQV